MSASGTPSISRLLAVDIDEHLRRVGRTKREHRRQRRVLAAPRDHVVRRGCQRGGAPYRPVLDHASRKPPAGAQALDRAAAE